MIGRRRRILFAMAMPGHLFHADRKARILRQKLAPLLEQGLATLDVEPAVRADQLQRILRNRRPDVLHIVCHGGNDDAQGRVLVLEDRRGQPDRLGADRLATLVKEAGIRPEVVILEACRSHGLAEELAKRDEVGSTIGVREDIDVEASTRFFVSLLQALAWGTPVDVAFADARRDLELLAPSIWSLPVLYGDSRQEVQPEPLDARTLAASLDIDPTRAETHVSLAEPLRAPSACFGREPLLKCLDDAWLHGTQRIMHLRGGAGMGKTTLLAEWLDHQAQHRWQGATRVFTWSFDPLVEGHGCGSPTQFVEQAQDFFGAVEPVLLPTRADADDRGEWLDGLRLGRAIRHERALLCLDGVPLLPHPAAAAHGPLTMLPPVIAALLQELARGRHALCVLTTRSSVPLKMDHAHDEPLGPLDPDAAAALLAHRGVIGHRQALRQRAREIGGHPATLATIAEAAKVYDAQGTAVPTDVPGVLASLGDAELLLGGLAHGGGSLSFEELRALANLPEPPEPPEPEPEPAWDDFDDAMLQSVRRARAAGIVRTTDRCGVILRQPATLEHLPRSAAACAALSARAEGALSRRLEQKTEAPAHLRAVRLALQRGAEGAPDAVRRFVDDVCHRGEDEYQTCYLSRTLGAIADELWFLAEFFEPGPDGSLRGDVLRPGVAQADPPHGAFFHHRLGLALRHLGRSSASVESLERAFALYAETDGGCFEVRAATCANDLAETWVSQNRLDRALEWAQRADHHAKKAIRGSEAVATVATDDPTRMKQLVQYLCAATLGHVHERCGELEKAEACFEHAKTWVRIHQHRTDQLFQRLFSRPGHQYWCFLLVRLEQHVAGGVDDEESRGRVQAAITELLEHFDGAEHWCEKHTTARVSRAYHRLARGRLWLLAEARGFHHLLPGGGSALPSRLRRAREDLFYAVHVLRAQQHLWMLPEALDARARLFELLDEPELARLDCDEAEDLRAAFRGSP